MKRYSQPKAGTIEKDVKKDLDNQKKPAYIKRFDAISYYSSLYRGNLDNEWQ